MLVTSCIQRREIKVWQCGANSGGEYEVNLFRSFDVNSFLKAEDILNDDAYLVFMNCAVNFDGTKIIVATPLAYVMDDILQRRGFVFTIDVDSGRRTEFMSQQLVGASIDALAGSPTDNKFAVIIDKWIYVWDIDAGPGVPLYRFPEIHSNYSSYSVSTLLALNTVDNCLVRGVYEYIMWYKLEDGSEYNKASVSIVRAISVSLPLQRIASVSKSLITIFDLQSATHLIEWGINRPDQYSRDMGCNFLQFGHYSTDLLTSHPATKSVFIWNSVTGEVLREIVGLLKFDSVRWCEVGRLMVAFKDGNMKVLDSNTGEELCSRKAHDSAAQAVGGLPQLSILL
jgi:hypothetical protein